MKDQDRFWKKVDRSGGPDSCWPWTAGKVQDGYGMFWRKSHGQNVKASRTAWEFTNGPIPEGKCVCHSCDNRACCNPEHLWIGTHKDNTQDMLRKGRRGIQPPGSWFQGEECSHAILTEDQVREVRRRYASLPISADGKKPLGAITRLAQEMGISRVQVYPILSGRTWKHVA